MTTVDRESVSVLGVDLLAEFDKLTTTDLIWPESDVDRAMVVHDMVRHAPNLLLALARARKIPLSEVEALRALVDLGGILTVPKPPTAKVRSVSVKDSRALMTIVLTRRSQRVARMKMGT